MKLSLLRGAAAYFNAPAEGGGGGSPPAPAPAAGAAPAPGASPSLQPGGAPPVAGGAAPAPAPAADYWPEGLDPTWKGADSKTTMDTLAKQFTDLQGQVKGFRDAQAARGVPENPEGYTDFSSSNMQGFQIDPKFQPHFEALKTDPVFSSMAKTAHSHGIGQKALAEIYQQGLVAMSEAGMMEPPLDVAAEKLALVPEAARALPQPEQDAAVKKRLNENYAFLDLAVANMGMPKDMAKHLELSLGDSAAGHQALEWMRGRLTAGGAGPGALGGQGGGETRESLKAAMAELDKHKHSDDYAKKHADLMQRYQRFLGG